MGLADGGVLVKTGLGFVGLCAASVLSAPRMAVNRVAGIAWCWGDG